MNALLPLAQLSSILPVDQPFTPAMARTEGIGRAAVERMLRDGTLRRVLRGVYVSGITPDSFHLRAAALRLVVARDALVVDRTAGWLHGVEACTPGEKLPPFDVLSPRRRSAPHVGGRHLVARDVMTVDGLLVTTPLRTALDLGRTLRPGAALATLDQLLASGSFAHTQLLAELPRFAGHRGIGQLRTLAAQADARAEGQAESELRLHWHQAELPTAVPGHVVSTGRRHVRVALGIEARRFGAALAHQITADDLLALEGAGWRVVVLAQTRLLHTDPALWVRHLEREWHQHLLAEVVREERCERRA